MVESSVLVIKVKKWREGNGSYSGVDEKIKKEHKREERK